MTELLVLSEARRRIAAVVPHGRTPQATPLLESLGQCLAEDLLAPEDLPRTDRSAMDGFAVRVAEVGQGGLELKIVGESRAGQPFAGELAAGTAVRIMTGATVPAGADAVVMVEETSGFDGENVRVHKRPSRGDHIRKAGSEVRRDERLLAAGTRIGPAQLGVLATCGVACVRVFARPTVAVLPTGDEVVDVGETPGPHQVRNSESKFAM